MNLKRGILRIVYLLFLFICVQTGNAQLHKFGMFLSGGINMSKMNDINTMYIKGQELEGYKEIHFTYGLSGGLVFRLLPHFSSRVGFYFFNHRQDPSVELVWSDDEVIEGKISFQIRGYCPFIGLGFNSNIGTRYTFRIGMDMLFCMAQFRDELPDAGEYFAMLYGNAFGFNIGSSIRRKISDQFDAGLQFGYRFLNIQKLKIDTDYYTDYPGDVEFTIEGKTLDLDFSGPFIELLCYFKL